MIAIMIAGAVSALVSLLGTRFLIVFFQARGQGQPILVEDDRTLGLEHHMPKQGTPTMGGLAIIGAALIGWIAFGEFPDAWTLTGGGVIILSGLYALRRERVRSGL